MSGGGGGIHEHSRSWHLWQEVKAGRVGTLEDAFDSAMEAFSTKYESGDPEQFRNMKGHPMYGRVGGQVKVTWARGADRN